MKDLKGYEGLYGVTSCGKIWSYISQKFLATYFANGYEYATLKDNQHVKISRAVAEAYIPNPNNLPQVNHKDEIKAHNYVNNLEWCDANYNINYGTRNERVKMIKSKKVYCRELDKVFESQKVAAAELGLDQGNISRVCRGKANTTGGYHFEFYVEKEETNNE